MSDLEPKKPVVALHRMAKVLAISAIGMILSLGLCKVGFWQGRNIHDGGPTTLDALGGIGFVLCLLTFLVSLLIMAAAVIVRLLRKGFE